MMVTVFGLGYVGAVTSACLAHLGHSVLGVDVDPEKVGEIELGRAPIVEPLLDSLIAEGRAGGRLRATTQVQGALDGSTAVVVCVGTPTRRDGTVEVEPLLRVSREIGHELARAASSYPVVVFRSTAPPGTVENRLVPLLEDASGLRAYKDFGVAMAPEFLREGSGVSDFLNPAMTIAGTTDAKSAEVVRDLFGRPPSPFRHVSTETAEAVKYASNAFHAVKVTFANEVARIASSAGADSRLVMETLCLDDRLNISPAYLKPGFSFGGSCLPKDLRAFLRLARSHNVEVPMLDAVSRSNDEHLQLALRLVLDRRSRDISMLGLSFKQQTDDLRESPYVALAELLIGKGMRLRIFDPVVNPERLRGANLRYVAEHVPHLRDMLVSSADEALAGSGVAVVASSEPDVVRALLRAQPPYLLDLNGSLGVAVEALPGYRGLAW